MEIDNKYLKPSCYVNKWNDDDQNLPGNRGSDSNGAQHICGRPH